MNKPVQYAFWIVVVCLIAGVNPLRYVTEDAIMWVCGGAALCLIYGWGPWRSKIPDGE